MSAGIRGKESKKAPIEHTRRYTWAKAVLGIVGLIFIVLCICGVYLLITLELRNVLFKLIL